MPCRIHTEPGLIVLNYEGLVDAHYLRNVLMKVIELESTCETIPHRLSVFHPNTQVDLDFLGVMQAANLRRERVFPNRFKSATVVSNALQTGFVRMFQQLNDNPQIEQRVFQTEAEARAWLASDGPQAP